MTFFFLPPDAVFGIPVPPTCFIEVPQGMAEPDPGWFSPELMNWLRAQQKGYEMSEQEQAQQRMRAEAFADGYAAAARNVRETAAERGKDFDQEMIIVFLDSLAQRYRDFAAMSSQVHAAAQRVRDGEPTRDLGDFSQFLADGTVSEDEDV